MEHILKLKFSKSNSLKTQLNICIDDKIVMELLNDIPFRNMLLLHSKLVYTDKNRHVQVKNGLYNKIYV